LPLLDINDILAYFAEIQATASEILQIIHYHGDDGTNDMSRTRDYFESWLRIASPEVLVKFIQATTGASGITQGMELLVFSLCQCIM